MRIFFRLFLLVLFLYLPGIAFSQYAISGKVVEKGTGETLPFATVLIHKTSIGTTTNQDGFFALFDIDSIETVIEVTYVGFISKLIKLDTVNLDGLLRISLEAQSAQLEEVVVTANSYKVLDATNEVSKLTLSTKQLSLLPNVGETDIFRSLQLLPGVSATNESSSGLFVRGGTPDQNLVLLDGITVYKVDHFFGFFSAFNSNAVKDVQLYKGAFPAKYGGRTSSVVEMTGKTGSFEKFSAGASVNFLSANAYVEVPISDKFSFLVAGRRSYTDIIQSDLFRSLSDVLVSDTPFDGADVDPSNITSVEPEFYFFDWNSKLSFRPSEKDLITLSVYNGKDFLDESNRLDRQIVANQTQDIRVEVDIAETTNWGNRGISTKWSRQWSPRFYSNVLLAASEYFGNYSRDASLMIFNMDTLNNAFFQKTFEDNNVNDLSARADFEWQTSSRFKTDFGFSVTNTKVDYTSLRNDTISILETEQEALFSSFYLSEEAKFGKHLTLNAGVRVSDYEFEEDLLIEPRFNLNYKFLPKWTFKAAYGIHYQFVNQIVNESITEGSREFWLLADDELIKVSGAKHYVLGLSYEINNWLFDAEGYFKEYSDISEFSLRFGNGVDTDVDQLFFTGDGIAKGVEFLVQKKQGKYTGWASYTLGSVRNTFVDFNEGKEFPALHDQLHEFKMVHSYELENWTLSSTFVFGSGKPYSEPEGQYSIELLDGRTFNYVGIGPKNGSRLPAYHRLDISASHNFKIGKAKGQLGLSIFNLYGRKNVWYLEYDFSQEPVLITEVTYLGFTPNVSLSVKF